MDIRKICMDSYGTLNVEEYKTGRYIKHEWNGVPKDVMRKVLDCKEPTVKDINEWVNKAKEKRDNKCGKGDCVPCDDISWW